VYNVEETSDMPNMLNVSSKRVCKRVSFIKIPDYGCKNVVIENIVLKLA